MTTLPQHNVGVLLSLAVRTALEAGKRIMEIYTDPSQDFGIERKADNSPVTLADKAAHATIIGMLESSGLPTLSEEGEKTTYTARKKWEAFWMIDPLDGTKEFINRNGEFTVNIALIRSGRPQMGVVYSPVRQELYFADPQFGSFKISSITDWNENENLMDLIGRSQRLPIPNEREDYVIVASRSHSSKATKKFIKDAELNHNRVTTISIGSSLKICLVAEGVADAYPRFARTHEWDTAAGHAVAACAGCQVLQADSDIPLEYNKKSLFNSFFLVKRITD